MLILSDAPFYDQAQQYVLARARKMPWLVGQLLCVLAAAGLSPVLHEPKATALRGMWRILCPVTRI